MKIFLRKLLFVKSYLYIYPYSLLNLENELKEICESEIIPSTQILNGKVMSESEFSFWEKWNLFRGSRSSDALAFFLGTIVIEQNKVNIVGTAYPNPISILGFYFTMLILGIILIIKYKTVDSYRLTEVAWILGTMSIIILSSSLYFRERIRKRVEKELKLTLEK